MQKYCCDILVSPGSVWDTFTYLVTRSAPRRVLLNCVMSGAASTSDFLFEYCFLFFSFIYSIELYV